MRRYSFAILALVASTTLTSCGGHAATTHIGALYALSGPNAPSSQDTYLGVTIARDLVNADGGVNGTRIILETQEVHDSTACAGAVNYLLGASIPIIIGTYEQPLSNSAAEATVEPGVMYWEAGSSRDVATGKNAELVFRQEILRNASVNALKNSGVYSRFLDAWKTLTQSPPTPDAIRGFTSGWILFHEILPRAHSLAALDIAAAARTVKPLS